MARECFGDENIARQWFGTDDLAFNNELPLKLLDTPADLRGVDTLLGRMANDIYS